jgi:hypothetical protein
VGREEGSYCRAVSQMQERWEVEYTLAGGAEARCVGDGRGAARCSPTGFIHDLTR